MIFNSFNMVFKVFLSFFNNFFAFFFKSDINLFPCWENYFTIERISSIDNLATVSGYLDLYLTYH